MVGRLLDGRYQIRSRIARGGMATVYLATDLRLERRVAIKVMHGHLADDSKFKERFIQEARSAARLAHPNVVNVFDQGQDSDMAYLVMEYLPGITLRDLLNEHKLLNTEQTLDVMEAVLSGLAAAHKSGIVHRDLKPENVLLADDGRIKIGDFGLARAASANTATGAALLGTIAYLSPELVTRGVADTRSDIYAVGIMMYEMLTGEQPFTGEQPMQIAYQHANETVPKPSARNAKVPPELDELVLWATSRDPEKRPKDARAMLDRLYETHTALMTAQPAATQRTMVMPSAAARAPGPGSTAETQVLGSRGGSPAIVATAADRVTAAPKTTRRRRVVWLVVVIAVIAALGATAGWYFGAGPGSKTTIPSSIANLTVDEARAALEELGLTVSETVGEIDSPTVPVGLVAETDPSIGSQVPSGSEVQLLASTGPKPLPVPALAGMTEEQARAAIEDARFSFEGSIEQFDAEVPSGIVIDALAADGTSLAGVPTYGELQKISLVVSVGPLPDLAGLSVDQATAALEAVGLAVGAIREEEFSDTVEQGAVLRAQLATAAQPVRVGDTIDLITSRGVELVAVPDVAGMTVNEATAELEAADFTVVDPGLSDAQRDLFKVTGTDPAADVEAEKGSGVTFTGFSIF